MMRSVYRASRLDKPKLSSRDKALTIGSVDPLVSDYGERSKRAESLMAKEFAKN